MALREAQLQTLLSEMPLEPAPQRLNLSRSHEPSEDSRRGMLEGAGHCCPRAAEVKEIEGLLFSTCLLSAITWPSGTLRTWTLA